MTEEETSQSLYQIIIVGQAQKGSIIDGHILYLCQKDTTEEKNALSRGGLGALSCYIYGWRQQPP